MTMHAIFVQPVESTWRRNTLHSSTHTHTHQPNHHIWSVCGHLVCTMRTAIPLKLIFTECPAAFVDNSCCRLTFFGFFEKCSHLIRIIIIRVSIFRKSLLRLRQTIVWRMRIAQHFTFTEKRETNGEWNPHVPTFRTNEFRAIWFSFSVEFTAWNVHCALSADAILNQNSNMHVCRHSFT